MTNQPQITPDELSAKWSILLNQAFIQIITLEKQLAAQAVFIQEMTTSQVVLEDELALLKSEIHELQHELQKGQNALSSEATEIAAQGTEIIANEKEKATPIESTQTI